jgi:hypothetical protein
MELGCGRHAWLHTHVGGHRRLLYFKIDLTRHLLAHCRIRLGGTSLEVGSGFIGEAWRHHVLLVTTLVVLKADSAS